MPPRLDPISTVGCCGTAGSSRPRRSSMRVTVSVAKSGSLKSGLRSSTPCVRKRSDRNAAFVDFADEAKPCR